MAKFLLRSHCLSVYNNLTIEQQINHGAISNVYHLPCVTIETIEWEKRRFFVYMMTASAYHVISKEVENRIFRHNRTFRHTFMYQQPTLTSSGIITFLCKYYIVISDTLISSWMSFFFARCKPRRKD